MSWFGAHRQTLRAALDPPVPGLSGAVILPTGRGAGVIGAVARRHAVDPVRGARYETRGQGVSRYALLNRVRSKRWGEPSAAPLAGRHTAPTVRFATESARPVGKDSGASRNRPGVVIIASPSDLLAQLVATSLIYAHVPTCQLDPAELKDVEVEWHGTTVSVNGHPVSGLLWRALGSPDASPSSISDHLDSRVVATWLAAASFPSVRAINAYDPAAWRQGADWSVWKDRLDKQGVPVQPPDGTGADSPGVTSLVVCGTVVSGPEAGPVSAAAEALESSGVRLAGVTCLPNGRVCDVDPQPQISDSLEARRAATRIANYLAA